MKDVLKYSFVGIMLSLLVLAIVFCPFIINSYIKNTIDNKNLEVHEITIEEKYIGMVGQYSYRTYYQVIDVNGNVYEVKTPSLYIQMEKGKTYKIETKRKNPPKLIINIEGSNNEL